ncbi:hypothetical protein ACFL6U_27510 [Planctomycetota bacterium]
MKKVHSIFTVVALMVVLTTSIAQAKVIRNAIWCDDELFGVTVTPQDVPEKGPFDVIYAFGDSGLIGQRSISDSKPGDADYNGGRWEVTPVTFTAAGLLAYDMNDDGVIDAELTSDGEIAAAVVMGYLTIGDPVRHFVCPLHPQRGN